MTDPCSFQPQINPHSRHLARHAPTLRERQKQEQQQYADREDRHGQPQRGAGTHSPRAQAFTVEIENDVTESVWDLWRAVARKEARESEAPFVRSVHSRNDDGDSFQCCRPRVVYVKTVLGMLNSLGVTSPRHDDLIAKFLKAMSVESSVLEASKCDVTVDAARFMYVFSIVWRAAVTNGTRSISTPTQLTVQQRSSPVAQQRGKSSSRAKTCCTVAEEDSRRGPVSSRMKTALTLEPSTPEVVKKERNLSAVSDRASSLPSVVSISSESSVKDAHSEQGSASHFTSSGNENGRENDTVQGDAEFLSTNVTDTSSSTSDQEEKLQSGVRDDKLSPTSTVPLAKLSSPPDPRNPDKFDTDTSSSPIITHHTHHRPPSAAALRLSSTAMPQNSRMRSSLRAIPNNSHLLSSTTSRELKKSAKCVPGGPMRECTFKPIINPVPNSFPASSHTAVIVPQRRPLSAPFPTYQSITQPLHQVRDSLTQWTRKSIHANDSDRIETPAAPMPAEFETAVRRMVAARQQRQCLESPQRAEQYSAQHSANMHQSVAHTTAADPRKPVLYVDVDLPHGIRDRLALYAGDTASHVALRFSILHGLSDSLRQRLERALAAELHALSIENVA